MKRYLVILPLLLAAAVGTLLFGHRWVNRARDQVEITEYVLAGDPAAAGVHVTYRAQDQDGHLFWETTFAPGTSDRAETAFTFSAQQQTSPYRWDSRVDLYTFSSGGYTMTGGFSRLTEDIYTDIPVRAVLDVADRTPDGEERTERVPLAAYYEYYPVTLQIDGNSYRFDSISSLQNGYLRDYLKIKVPEEKSVEITVRKNRDGELDFLRVDASISEQQDSALSSGVVTERGAYFYAYSYDKDGKIDSRLECPNGVHFIPAQDPEHMTGDGWWDLSGIRLFYPAGDGETIVYLSASSNETKLLLYTHEAENLFLTVLDAASGEALQKVALLEVSGDLAGLFPLEQNDLYFVTWCGEFCLVAENGGRYEKVLTGTIPPESRFVSYLVGDHALVSLSWNGQRMAIAGATNYCSFYNAYDHNMILGVWDKDGLCYMGAYDYGISRDPYARTRLSQYQSSYETFDLVFTGS